MCKKGFCQSRTLAVHKMIHQEGSPHKCDVCKKVFNQRSNLKTHMRTHTDEKPYMCKYDDCGKEFRRNCDLRRHNLTHLDEAAAAAAAGGAPARSGPELAEQQSAANLSMGARERLFAGAQGARYSPGSSTSSSSPATTPRPACVGRRLSPAEQLDERDASSSDQDEQLSVDDHQQRLELRLRLGSIQRRLEDTDTDIDEPDDRERHQRHPGLSSPQRIRPGQEHIDVFQH